MKNYKVGFWNYKSVPENPTGEVLRWADVGINMPSSFEYENEEKDKRLIQEMLSACKEKNMEVILFDPRTKYRVLEAEGEEVYRQNVRAVAAEFAGQTAFKYLYLGDEPHKKQLDMVARAYEIVREECSYVPFVNYYPRLEFKGYTECTGFSIEHFEEEMSAHFQRVKPEIVSYDCYMQMDSFAPISGIRMYFENLMIYQRLAKKYNAALWTSLASVGHWQYRSPSEDDIRWQYSTAASFGYTGMMWFYFYEWKLEENYRNAPIDLYNGETDCYRALKKQTKVFLDYHAPVLTGAELEKVYLINDDNTLFTEIEYKKDGLGRSEWEKFTAQMLKTSAETDYINEPSVLALDKELSLRNNHSLPLAISVWKKDGKRVYTACNLSQKKVGRVALEDKGKNQGSWLAPGQLVCVTEI